jgi:hypothetical protein
MQSIFISPADDCSISYQLLLNVFVTIAPIVFIFPTCMTDMEDDPLKCNICGMTISSSQAMQHASTSSHGKRKTELEQELKALTKENYKNDLSVLVQWQSSLAILR